MRVGSLVALWAPVAALATIGCGGNDSVTGPAGDLDLRAGKQPMTYEVQLLPVPANASNSGASAINAKGQIVGSVNGHAARWDPGAEPVDLGVLPGLATSGATGISDAGDVVGVSAPPIDPDDPHPPSGEAVRWAAGGGIQDLGGLCCETISGTVTNARGDVAWVGSLPGNPNSFGLQLLRHGTSTTVVDELEFPRLALRLGLAVAMNNHDAVSVGQFVWSPKTGWSAAYGLLGDTQIIGLNDRNDVVTVVYNAGTPTLYPAKGAPVALGFTPSSINKFGVIAGNGADGAVVRYADGTIVSLPVPQGYTSAGASQINDAGIVVGSSVAWPVGRATVWRPVRG